jgi:hypothetical protein
MKIMNTTTNNDIGTGTSTTKNKLPVRTSTTKKFNQKNDRNVTMKIMNTIQQQPIMTLVQVQVQRKTNYRYVQVQQKNSIKK